MPPLVVRRKMPLAAALQALADARSDQFVISSMGAVREWPKVSSHPRDFQYMPSTMGGVAPLGLGLALARPDREFIVLSGDGSLMMNLGCLSTIAASGATNLTLIVLANEVYEITGGQPTAGAIAEVDFTLVARGSGLAMVWEFDDLEHWRKQAPQALAAAGPRLVVLHVEPVTEDYHVSPPPNVRERVGRLREEIGDRIQESEVLK